VRFEIHSAGARAAVVLLCLSVIAPYGWWIERVYRASRLADSNRLEDLERAARLVPENAEFPHAAGLQLSESFQSYESAIRYLQTAATLDPYNANDWLDLASIDLAAGKLPGQDAALEQALEAEPGNPDVVAEVADYYLAAGEVSRALPLFRRAMVEDPSSAESLLGVSWSATRDAKLMLDQVVPPNPEIQLEFLRLLTDRGDSASAHLVWQHLLAGRAIFRPQLSFFYFDYMIRVHESENFARACAQLPDDLPSLKNYSPNENLIVNPSFELPLLYGGCDWRYERVDHAAAGIDDQVAHSGSRSLSATFDGSTVSDLGWKEYVSLQSNKDYEFSAWIKSEDIVSSSGPRFSIADAYTGDTILLTDDILDTHSWHEIRGSFRAPEKTQLATIRIIRSPGNTMIRGRVWIDDLRLVPR
jgi:tetratricopeptide (TPR) repeat protein